jgi:nicotinate-nucleotide adenylyltransferase
LSVDLSMKTRKRIGVFGGSFDPPHLAHVALALAAIKTLELDELRIVPTGQAWHKARALSPPEHRLAMTRLAFQDLLRAVVDERELQRSGPTFTIDTLEALQSENPEAQLYLIMGEDQFAAFHQWHQWQAILRLAIICIAGRALFKPVAAGSDAYKEIEHRFVRLPMPPMPVSATEIRQRVAGAAGKPPEITDLIIDMVSEPVARYISMNRLYTTC